MQKDAFDEGDVREVFSQAYFWLCGCGNQPQSLFHVEKFEERTVSFYEKGYLQGIRAPCNKHQALMVMRALSSYLHPFCSTPRVD